MPFVGQPYHKNNSSPSLSLGMVDLKILQSHWSRAFWPISQEQDFSQTWDMCKNIADNINFHYKPNSGKINDLIFQ